MWCFFFKKLYYLVIVCGWDVIDNLVGVDGVVNIVYLVNVGEG